MASSTSARAGVWLARLLQGLPGRQARRAVEERPDQQGKDEGKGRRADEADLGDANDRS